MADNTALNTGSGGDTIATDDIGGVKHQRVKVQYGDDGSATDVSDTNPMPVDDAGGSLTVDGTVTANLAAGTNNIGDVDVLSVVPGTGATNLGKAEDDPHTSGDVGVMALFVRQNSQADLAADGDYVPGTIADDGGLRVNVTNGAAGGTSSTDDAAFTAAAGSGTPMMGFATSDAVDSGDVGVVAMTTARAMHVHIASFASSQTDDAAFTPASSLVSVIAGEFDDTLPDPVDEGDAGAVRMSANRNLYTTIRDAAGNERGVNVNASNQLAIAGPVTNAGTFAVQVDGAALTALQLIDNPVLVDDAVFSPATSSVMMAGFQADEASTDPVDEGDAGAARMTLTRKVITTPQPHTAGGLSIFRSIDLDESEEEVKATAGQVYSMWVTNTATATRWVKFYNDTAANVAVGTTTPVITIGIPGNTSDDVSGHFAAGGYGLAFSTAICVAATTGVADNDTGAPGANEVIVNIGYA